MIARPRQSAVAHARIAVVEADDGMLSVVLEALAEAGHSAMGIPSEDLAIAVLPRLRIDVVVVGLAAEGAADRIRTACERAGKRPGWVHVLDPGACVAGDGAPTAERPLTRAALLCAVETALATVRARGAPTEPEIDVSSLRAWQQAG